MLAHVSPCHDYRDVLPLLLADRIRSHVRVHLLLRVVPDGARVEHEYTRLPLVLASHDAVLRKGVGSAYDMAVR